MRRESGAPVLVPLDKAVLRELMTRCVKFVRRTTVGDEVKETAAHPPGWCVEAVFARGHWAGVRRLDGLVPHPAFLADGSVLAECGYHAASGLYAALEPGLAVSVPDSPTQADAARAAEVLFGLVCDFPFEAPAHRSAWLAGLLTSLAWFSFDGPAPLFLVDGNVRGVGKGLLADAAAIVVTGRRFGVLSYTSDREELRKKITTLAMEGDRAALLDNLAGHVGSDVLDSALTSDRWKDRVLGSNRGYEGPLAVTWWGTGNNVQLGADLSRRVCHVRLESPEERPETKGNFKHPDLRGHARENRGVYLTAALTILRAWHAAGRPSHGLAAWGSYEGWSGVVREAIAFAGLPDPGEARQALQTAADRDAASVRALLDAVERIDPHRRGVTAGSLVGLCKDHHPADAELQGELRAAVEDLCGRTDARLLGYKLRHFKRRNFGGRMLDEAGSTGGSVRWVVCRAESIGRATSAPAPADPDGGGGEMLVMGGIAKPAGGTPGGIEGGMLAIGGIAKPVAEIAAGDYGPEFGDFDGPEDLRGVSP